MTAARPTRDAYGDALLELGELDHRVVVLDADLSRSTTTDRFAQRYPGRFFNVGIAEQNLMGMAAGLSMTGLIPFATTYAIFISRAFDQIRQAIAFASTNVKVVATHAGLAASYDGGSHQGILDLALMRALPGMTVLSPVDYHAARGAILAAASRQGPIYVRLQKEAVPILTPFDEAFEIGATRTFRDGDDVAIFATGSMVSPALDAAERLAQSGVEARVIEVGTLKPLDREAVREAATACGCAVTAEEHSRYGGLYDAVLHALAGEIPCPAVAVAINDRFGETGSWHQLRRHNGLSEEGIVNAALQALTGRHRRPVRAGRP